MDDWTNIDIESWVKSKMEAWSSMPVDPRAVKAAVAHFQDAGEMTEEEAKIIDTLFAVVCNRYGETREKEDVMQECWAEFLRDAPNIDTNQNVFAYLYTRSIWTLMQWRLQKSRKWMAESLPQINDCFNMRRTVDLRTEHKADPTQIRRHNALVEINGQAKTLREWAEEFQADFHLAGFRIYHGWQPLEALTKPKGSRRDK